MALTANDKDRLIAVLENKMCRPCLRDGAVADHEGCVEAEALIKIVQQA